FIYTDTATTDTYTLSLHDALPISSKYAPTNTGKLMVIAAIIGMCHGRLLRFTVNKWLSSPSMSFFNRPTTAISQNTGVFFCSVWYAKLRFGALINCVPLFCLGTQLIHLTVVLRLSRCLY